MLENLIMWSSVLLGCSLFGYLVAVLKEKVDLYYDRVHIPSERITQQDIDSVDLKAFRVGKINLMIGDEIKVYLKNNVQVRGVVLGARKKKNALCLVTKEDELLELSVATIRKLKVMTRYGRLL